MQEGNEKIMQWKKVSDEKPPKGKDILLLVSSIKSGIFNSIPLGTIIEVKTYRPFERDKKYNPDYYEFKYCSTAFELNDEDYWMEIEKPEQFKFINSIERDRDID
jgi:hypothetical protein